jgi:5-methylcytosine-specific restriction endonuclease McrA
MKSEIAIFGNTQMQRVWCSDCGALTFIRNGHTVCCGHPLETPDPKRYIRECEPYQVRKLPSKQERDETLLRQDGRCFYCDQPLGSTQWRETRRITLRTHWDHLIPYAYSQDNHAINFVAACHVCNGIKSSHVFRTVEDARVFIADRRKLKGYSF